MICKCCNHQNHENNKFCINCGKELTNNRCFSNNQEYDQYNNLGNYSFDNDVNNKIYNNQYQNSYQTDNTIQNEIVKNRNERSQLRDSRERAAADKSALGK